MSLISYSSEEWAQLLSAQKCSIWAKHVGLVEVDKVVASVVTIVNVSVRTGATVTPRVQSIVPLQSPLPLTLRM